MSESPARSAVEASQRIRTVVGRLRRRILNAASAEDITLAQVSVLTHLTRSPGRTVSELAAADGVRHQSMTSTISSLHTRGLVERAPDPTDRRRMLITLTAEGHRRVAEGRQLRQEWLTGQLQDRCTEEERHLVIAAMTVLERLTLD
ncbi:MarR family winged helix-turn-helix transcriptional regulator [Amycolatopsis jiangsuensis]|uniref:DNA-binding MarR family transcriptional regulator n=1 Tax=Amycolatopsis jiangsuensis TaxID=1181879 RepID=A0A840IMI4_9PSEU|nr:MarR family transcriptional regulator [Amycolatopsis jiangsuensis]MBB4683546.1 DNA-binding MarR family transcriptional regulator [Amycolatopsis jiangsuensis]